MKNLFLLLAISLFSASLSACPAVAADPVNTMTGTITYIGSATDVTNFSGKTVILAIDDDTESRNDTPIRTFNLTWGTGTTLNYSIDLGDLPDGDYYVFVEYYSLSFWAYGYYNNNPSDAYGTKVLISIHNGVVVNIEFNVT